MKQNDFFEKVRISIEEYMGDRAKVTLNEIIKNNAVKLNGLSILEDGRNISPTIYLNSFYERYSDGEKMEDIIVEVLELYQKSKPDSNMNIDFFTDYEAVQEIVLCKLISFDKNIELLQEIPYIRFLDLAIVFYCFLVNERIGSATIMVYNRHLKMWGTTTAALYKKAIENTRRLLGYQITGIEDVMREMLIENLRAKLTDTDDSDREESMSEDKINEFADTMLDSMKQEGGRMPMYVLSNQDKINGAACILYPDLLLEFAEGLGRDLYIIPSSIHEVILVPALEEQEHESLSKMVREVNSTQVEEEEVLADHVYFFSREVREVCLL